MSSNSESLAQIISLIYSSTSHGASATTYAVKSKHNKPDKADQMAYLGKAVANTGQAVTHALIVAGLNNTGAIAQASLAASGLSFLSSLPSAIDALSSLGLSEQGVSTKQLYQESQQKTEQATKALKTSLLVTGPTKHDNIARLLFDLPIDTLQDKAHHNLFPVIKKKLVQNKRGDAIAFYKKWLASDQGRQELMQSFKGSLANYDSEDMESPAASLGEVACMLSLLDPEKDQRQITAMSSLFNDMLMTFRQQLQKDKDCASALDEANKVLLNLMVTTYTGRADRKKVKADQLKLATNILSGVGIVLSAAIAIHTVGLSVPATAILATKIASSSVSVVSTSVTIAKMVQEGRAAEEIAQLLTPDVINALQKTDVAAELLNQSKQEIQAYLKDLLGAKNEVDSMSRSCFDEISKIEEDSLFMLYQLSQQDMLSEIFQDESFMKPLVAMISQQKNAADIFKQMHRQLNRSYAARHGRLKAEARSPR